MARSALKPYNGDLVARQKAVTKGVDTFLNDSNATASPKKFLRNNVAEMENITGEQNALLDEKGHVRADIGPIEQRLNDFVNEARSTPGTSEAAVQAAEKVLADIKNHPDYNPTDNTVGTAAAQEMKKNIWRYLREKGAFSKDAQPALNDAMWSAADGMAQIVSDVIPEMKTGNARYGELANLNKILVRSVNRIANNNLISLHSGMQLIRGDFKGLMQAAILKTIDHPTFKSYLAQQMAKARGGGVSTAEVNAALDTIKSEIVKRDQTVLDSENVQAPSRSNLGDAIPGGYQQIYGWDGKGPQQGQVLNPEQLPSRQSSQMPVVSGQPGRTVPQVESMTKRVPPNYNPEVVVGRESQLGDRIPGRKNK
jgi:hypothetical protein